MIYDAEYRLVRTAADQLGIPVYDDVLVVERSRSAKLLCAGGILACVNPAFSIKDGKIR